MSMMVDIRELPQRMTELLSAASDGTEIILTDGTMPRARLIPLEAKTRIAGLHPGAIQVGSDFDEPLLDSFWLGQP
jgi:antitoxin (DNA-binding transcriptional repressor) of toxin-antitoxin stability system